MNTTISNGHIYGLLYDLICAFLIWIEMVEAIINLKSDESLIMYGCVRSLNCRG